MKTLLFNDRDILIDKIIFIERIANFIKIQVGKICLEAHYSSCESASLDYQRILGEIHEA